MRRCPRPHCNGQLLNDAGEALKCILCGYCEWLPDRIQVAWERELAGLPDDYWRGQRGRPRKAQSV